MATVPVVRIRPWRPGDERLLADAAVGISAAALRSRFFAGVPRLPATYLSYVASAPRSRWDAQVAVHGDRLGEQLIGWAEFARAGGPAEADIAVLVLDAWQRGGVGGALVRSMLPRAARAGVRVLHADVEPGNGAVRGLLRSVLGPLSRSAATSGPGTGFSSTLADGLLHYTMRLDEEPR